MTLEEKLQVIETLKSALGTMVVEPNFISDPNNIGQKTYAGNIQKPILEGNDRSNVLQVLNSIINSI